MSGQQDKRQNQTYDHGKSAPIRQDGTGSDRTPDGAFTGEIKDMGKTGVVVVGAGIGGVRAALDLADSGHPVTLIDKAPYMGGLLSKLDHQFPTDGCGMCRMLPTIHRDAATQFCLRRGMAHENITLMCDTTLDHIEGEAGDYTLRLRQRNQWVNPDLCTGCGACTEVCPVVVPDRFNEGMSTQKAIDLPLPHATPKTYTIDTAHCTHCGECAAACPEKAITLPEDQKKQFRILVVDDELIVRDSVKEWFEFEGYAVDMADSGPKALEMIESSLGNGNQRYSLMMLDIKMPEMEGTEVLKRAKAIDPELNVVMMTAYATVKTAVETMQSGALEYIIKPFDPDTLIEKVDRIYQAGVQSDDLIFEVSAGALILTCGTGYYNPLDGPNTLGYKVLPDVMTGLEYERLLSGSGPTGGKLIRPSTGKAPQRIAWIQCVGSRDIRSGAPYCSSICCMFALKEAMLTKKQYGDAVETVIYYMDMRCFGKEFETYRKEAVEKYGVILKRARPHSVRPDEESGKLRIFMAHPAAGLDGIAMPKNDASGGPSGETETAVDSIEAPDGDSPMAGMKGVATKTDEIFDLVVLSVGQRPTPETKALAEMTGIPLNAFGFPETGMAADRVADPVDAKKREGIFVGGAFGGGRDIAESVIEASAAAAKAMAVLNKTAGDERSSVSTHRSKSKSNATGAGGGMGALDQGMADGEPSNGKNLLDALSPLLPSEVTVTTRLAAFQESKNGNDRSIQPTEVNERVLIIGGGVAGMTAALSVAKSGYPVVLVEKSNEMGGNLKWLTQNIKGEDFTALRQDLTEKIGTHPMITLYQNATVTASHGEVGAFESTVVIHSHETGNHQEIISHGATILATGAVEAKSQSHIYGLGEHPAVVTLRGLHEALNPHLPGMASSGATGEKMMATDAEATQNALQSDSIPGYIDPKALDIVVMIQCVESRDDIKPYCSRVCCTGALKQALALKRMNPDIQIFVLYRDIISYGFNEIYYDEARRSDIIFIQYTSDALPRVSFEKLEKSAHGEEAPDAKDGAVPEVEGGITITVHDPIIDRDLEISADLLVLATGMTANRLEHVKGEKDTSVSHSQLDASSALESQSEAASGGDPASILGIERDRYRFFKQGDSKWRPVDSSREGIFLCGTAMGPRDVEESMASARAAAMRAMRIVGLERLSASSVTAGVKTSLCSLCMKCVETCPYEARRFDEERRMIHVNGAMCQGCGACAAVCPNSASYLTDYSDQQMFERIDTAMGCFN